MKAESISPSAAMSTLAFTCDRSVVEVTSTETLNGSSFPDAITRRCQSRTHHDFGRMFTFPRSRVAVMPLAKIKRRSPGLTAIPTFPPLNVDRAVRVPHREEDRAAFLD